MNYSNELEFIKAEMLSAYKNHGNIKLHTAQKSAFDLVTDIDINIEKQLTEAICKAYPNDRIHGEEFSASANIVGRTWTIDPIDGTCNMASGSKLYGMQCSLIVNNEIVLGIVYLPHLDEWIYATKGGGCYYNGERITVNSNITLNNAILSFGDYPHTKDNRIADIQHTAIKRLYPKIAKIRMFGAACMDFSFVAQGRTHGTVVITKNSWDIAPGIVICKEAGAIITNLNGTPYKLGDDGVVVAANDSLSNLIRDSLAQNYNITIDGKTYSFDACIFDFDGVIADTEKFHYIAWNKAFKSVGVDLTPQDYIPLKSTGKANIIAFAETKHGAKFTDSQKAEIAKIKDQTFAEAITKINKCDIISGATEFLQSLKRNYVKVGVGSSSKTTTNIINSLELSDMFGAVIDGQTDLPQKPAPDIFATVMAKLGAKHENCLVFEDAPSGIEAALNAGAKVIAVGGIKDTRALLCINDFTELL
ncbi:MAG: HAD-IA family hydrolase [Clostridiales bacterium]|nr:HAD-IA family hydrolase [Clostridiales bacterium]